jgi:hypothetical protein
METFLNLLWVVITVVAIWLWRCRWIVSRPTPRPSPRLEAVAMVCALALLFPVISLTDDLHPEIVAVDAVSGKRNACITLAAATHARPGTAAPATHLVFGLLPERVAAAHFVSSQIFPLAEFHEPTSPASAHFGRSPPSLL